MGKNWPLWIGISMFSVLLFFTIWGDSLSFVDPSPADSRMRFYEDGSIARAPFPPSTEDFLGTDSDGRDLFSLLIIGTKDTLRYIFLITIIRYTIALPLAFLASSKKGLAYTISNSWNSLFSSVPTVFSAMLLLMLPRPIMAMPESITSMYWAIVLLALMEVGRVSWIISHEIYEVSEKEYVKAGILIGNRPFKLYTNYYLPNIMQNLIVNFFNDLGRVTLLVGQLALFGYFILSKTLFLEEGIKIISGTYDWPAMLKETKGEIIKAVWIPLVPALAITYTIFTFNLLGEGLRRRFDLATQQREDSLKESILAFPKKALAVLKSKAFRPVLVVIILVTVALFNTNQLVEIFAGDAKTAFAFGGKIKATPNLVTIHGSSSLPEGAVIAGKLFDSDTGAEVAAKDAAVREKGKFTLQLHRPDRNKHYDLEVVFVPKDQPPVVKERIGPNGEKISEESDGYVQEGDASSLLKTSTIIELPRDKYNSIKWQDTVLFETMKTKSNAK